MDAPRFCQKPVSSVTGVWAIPTVSPSPLRDTRAIQQIQTEKQTFVNSSQRNQEQESSRSAMGAGCAVALHPHSPAHPLRMSQGQNSISRQIGAALADQASVCPGIQL